MIKGTAHDWNTTHSCHRHLFILLTRLVHNIYPTILLSLFKARLYLHECLKKISWHWLRIVSKTKKGKFTGRWHHLHLNWTVVRCCSPFIIKSWWIIAGRKLKRTNIPLTIFVMQIKIQKQEKKQQDRCPFGAHLRPSAFDLMM